MVRILNTVMVLSSVLVALATEPGNGQGIAARHSAPIVQRTMTTQEVALEATYRLSSSKNSVMNLSGTTPVKNWTMTAIGLSGEARISVANGTLTNVESLIFKLPVYNLKGEVKAMDEDAYEALKADRHKEITFKLIDATVRTSNARFLVEACGSLTVAGVTKPVTLTMNASIDSDGAVAFTGSQVLKMSDYDVERPSLLFGAIKAGNEMTLAYRLVFTK